MPSPGFTLWRKWSRRSSSALVRDWVRTGIWKFYPETSGSSINQGIPRASKSSRRLRLNWKGEAQ
jgi:hypothetical protein